MKTPSQYAYNSSDDHFNGIPTKLQWVKITTPTTLGLAHRRNNQKLLDIDSSLDEYHKLAFLPVNESSPDEVAYWQDILIIALMKICKSCQDWIHGKALNKRIKTSYRARKVDNLWVEALNLIKALNTQQKAFEVRIKSGDEISKSKSKVHWRMAKRELHRLGVGQGKMLHEDYWGESHISNPRHLKQAAFQWQDSGSKESMFVWMKNNEADIKKTATLYIGKLDIWKYQIVFDNKGLAKNRVHSHDLTPGGSITTNQEGGWFFVIDPEGRCYTSPGEDTGNKKEGWNLFQHSSILSGGAVIYAGYITINNGVITSINNGSGHYRPTDRNTINALKVLEDNNVDITGLEVLSINPSSGNPMTWKRAGQELAQLSGGQIDFSILMPLTRSRS